MRALVFAIVMVLGGACTFDDPRYEDTSFGCSADDPCPEGQTCVAGRCEVAVSTADGIECGTAGTCAPGEQCCADVTTGPSCQPAGASCAGQIATCDGREDCDPTEVCCGSRDPVCGTGCAQLACSDNSECGGATPTCCRYGIAPWGLCSVC